MIKKALLILLLLLGIAVRARAQSNSRFKSPYLKNVSDARSRAVAGTLLPVAIGIGAATLIESKTVQTTGSLLAMYGLLMGPSQGNFYAKDYLRGMLGVAARAGSAFLLVDATREIAGDNVADALGGDDESVTLTDTRVLIGGGLLIGSAIYNIISAKASVNRFNRKTGFMGSITPIRVDGNLHPMATLHWQF